MKLLKRLVACLCILLLLGTQTAAAQQTEMTRDQKTLFPYLGSSGCTGASVTGANAMTSKEVWILGDSITYGARDNYRDMFEAKQITPTISGVASRSWNTPGEPSKGAVGEEGSGAEVVAREKEKGEESKLKTAGAIVIAFGSNGFGQSNPFDDAVTKIKEVNSTAPIYWVNTAFKDRLVAESEAFNDALAAGGGADKYTVIDWHGFVKKSGDESGVQGDLLSDYVHPTTDGYKKLAELVVNTVSAGPNTAVPTTTRAGCACSATNATGEVTVSPNAEENAKAIFQFFVGKGMTAEQAAGILGNIQHESGFNPRRVEGTVTPDGDSDTPDHRGYGIVQFTPGTKIVPAAEAADRPPGDLGFQLDFIWEQFMSNEGPAYEDLKSQTTVEGAARSFGLKYERYRADLEPITQPKRNEAALAWYEKFKHLGGASVGGACNPTPGGLGADGQPEGFIPYLQTDPKWKDIPYGNNNLGVSGCGATTMAMVIASMTKDAAITPARIVEDINAAGLPHTTESLEPFTAIPAKYGLKMTSYSPAQFDAVYEKLKSGPPGEVYVIANVKPGFWTSAGHYFLLTGVASDGKVIIKDTIERNPPVEGKTYDKEFFLTTGGSEATNPINFMVISK